MIAATTVKTMVESLKFPREVAATRVRSLIAARHGTPPPVETLSPKALGSNQSSLSHCSHTQTESRSVSVRRNVVPRWHGSSLEKATASVVELCGKPLSITAPWRLGHFGRYSNPFLLATTKAFDQEVRNNNPSEDLWISSAGTGSSSQLEMGFS